jgi:hypothetical protein
MNPIMKLLFVIIFALFISLQAFSQAADDEIFFRQKVEKYHRMKKTGQTLTLLGSVLSVVGIVTLSNSTTTTTSNGYGPSQTTTSGNPGAGVAAYLVGTACVGAGVPLWIVGGVSQGKYERKLNALTIGARVIPHGGGLTLRYRF